MAARDLSRPKELSIETTPPHACKTFTYGPGRHLTSLRPWMLVMLHGGVRNFLVLFNDFGKYFLLDILCNVINYFDSSFARMKSNTHINFISYLKFNLIFHIRKLPASFCQSVDCIENSASRGNIPIIHFMRAIHCLDVSKH